MKLNKIVTLAAGVLSLAAFSKTVALWPLDYNESGFDGRNFIEGSPALSLYASTEKSDETAFDSSLPPNPDRSVDLSENPLNGNSCYLHSDGAGFYTKDAGLLSKINRSCDAFTVEGWMKLYSFPASDSLVVLYHGNSGNGNRWFFTIRNSKTGVLTFQVFDGGKDKVLLEIDDTMKETLLNNWCHIALVYRKTDAEMGNKPAYCLYINSELRSSPC